MLYICIQKRKPILFIIMIREDIRIKTNNLLSAMYDEADETKYNELMAQLDPIGKILVGEEYKDWRTWVKARVEKQLQYKKPKWEKAKQSPKWPVKSSFIFREEEGQAFIALANALTEYLKSKTN